MRLLSDGTLDSSLTVGATTIGTVTTNSAGTLVLSFNANATNALVNEAMQQLAHANSSDAPPASVQIDWTFDDGNTGAQGTGGALQDTGSITVDITAVNDAPAVTAPGIALNATEQTSLSIEGTGFGVSDSDEAGSGAIATLTIGEGAITVVTGDSGITITGGNGTAAVTLSGTIAQVDNLLTGAGTGTITYLNSSDTPSASTTLSVTVNDLGNMGTDPGLTGDAWSESAMASVGINIAPVNDVPVGNEDSYVVGNDGVLTVPASGILANDVDVDNTLEAVLVSDPGHGELSLASDGSFEYIPDIGYHGLDFFTYVATDGVASSGTTIVLITIDPNVASPPSDGGGGDSDVEDPSDSSEDDSTDGEDGDHGGNVDDEPVADDEDTEDESSESGSEQPPEEEDLAEDRRLPVPVLGPVPPGSIDESWALPNDEEVNFVLDKWGPAKESVDEVDQRGHHAGGIPRHRTSGVDLELPAIMGDPGFDIYETTPDNE